jgi:peroxiredoxin
MKLKVGDQAPDFCLESHQGKKVCLRYFKGTRNVVMAFFPLAWTPV